MKVFFFIIIILIVYFFINKYIINHKQQDTISFDDIEKIKKQEAIEKQSIEYESKVLNRVYNDTY